MKHYPRIILQIVAITWLSLSLANPAHAAESVSQTNKTPLTKQQLIKMLGWVAEPAKNMCGGYYLIPEFLARQPNPQPIQQSDTVINAGGRTEFFAKTGVTVLSGGVTVRQPGRLLTAKTAHIVRSPSTGRLSYVDLRGNVHFEDANHLIISQRATYDYAQHQATLYDSVYRTLRQISTGVINAWGQAEKVVRHDSGIMNLRHASYTTCPPNKSVWRVNASTLHLNPVTGTGAAYNARISVKGIPILYSPYLSFPIDNRRKSGFLFPVFSYSNDSGFDLSLPYYFNLAPNYDLTITPRYLSKRGLMMGGQFRYLTHASQGQFSLSVLPGDREFSAFRAKAPSKYGVNAQTLPFLSRLKRDGNNRYYVSYDDTTRFNPHWKSSLDLNYTSDDYYFQDFGNEPSAINYDQLLNQADLNYDDENWHFLARVQAYQTLHPINQGDIENQYSRLPELDLNGYFPKEFGAMDYSFNSQFVYFDHSLDFMTKQTVPTGVRFNIEPGLSLPLVGAAGYFTPRLQIDATTYNLSNNVDDTVNRTLPIFDIDSGLFFERDFKLMGNNYEQTFEPRVFYLYVPYTNQNDIPLFDTTLPAFSVEQLFRTNRFVGIDRIGDANQVSLALTTRILDSKTGAEKMSASIGDIYYIQRHRVCITPNCITDPTVDDRFSPIVAELNYYLNKSWSLTGSAAWDPNQSEMNNGSVNLNYIPAPNHIIRIGYDFLRGGDIIDKNDPLSNKNNLDRIDIGFAWPLKYNWSAVANWNYNLSHSHPQSYFYGLEYDSCCWAMRIIASRTLTAENSDGSTEFDTDYYVQFQLKGLGNFGNNDPSNLLSGALPGYQDRLD